MTGSAGPLVGMWGPEKYGGKGDISSKLKEEMEKSDKGEIEAFYSEVCDISIQPRLARYLTRMSQ